MADGRRIIRPIVSIVLIAVTAFGLLNVFEDNTALIGQAQTVACGGTTCAVKMTRMERNPLFQTFTFQTSIKHQTAATVKCHRQFYLVGAYQCEKQ
jgi:hypothetical protein